MSYSGKPMQPIKFSWPNETPLSKGELNRIKKKKERNQAIAPEDEPKYVLKVKKEQKKREKEQAQALQKEKEINEVETNVSVASN